MGIITLIVMIVVLTPIVLVFLLCLLACLFGETEKERGDRVYRAYAAR